MKPEPFSSIKCPAGFPQPLGERPHLPLSRHQATALDGGQRASALIELDAPLLQTLASGHAVRPIDAWCCPALARN
jgi:hypothetical protein